MGKYFHVLSLLSRLKGPILSTSACTAPMFGPIPPTVQSKMDYPSHLRFAFPQLIPLIKAIANRLPALLWISGTAMPRESTQMLWPVILIQSGKNFCAVIR